MNQLILGTSGGGVMILWIVILFAMMYFLMIRPQKKTQDKHKQMLNALKINDRIQTVGGITGYVRDLNDNYIYIEIADGLVIELNRQYIAMVLPEDEDDEALPESDAEEIESVAQEEAAEATEEAAATTTGDDDTAADEKK